MVFKIIKNIVSPTANYRKSQNNARVKSSHIYKEFNMLALDVFDQRVVPFLQPDRFENGVLYINCSYSFMEPINDRKDYFLFELQEIFGEEIIIDVIFEV